MRIVLIDRLISIIQYLTSESKWPQEPTQREEVYSPHAIVMYRLQLYEKAEFQKIT